MKTTHAVLLVVLAVIAGGILFVRMHNPAAFDRLLGGAALVASPSAPSAPTLSAKAAAPALKVINAANAQADSVLHQTNGDASTAAPLSAAPSPVQPVKPTPPPIAASTPSPSQPAPTSAPLATFAASPPTTTPGSSGSSLMNSPSDVINTPSESTPTPAESTAPAAPSDNSTPVMSAAPSNGASTTAADWIAPSPTPAQANWTWTTTTGQTYKRVKVIKMDPQSVTILHQDGGATVPMETLPPDLQKLFNYNADAAAQWEVGKLVSGSLVVLQNGSLHPVDDSRLRSARYIAILYSGAWSETCNALSTKLIEFYNKFKPTHPEFEVLFVSEDKNPAAMLINMRKNSMPWPAVSYDVLIHPPGQFKGSGIESFAGPGIPDFVLLDATGRVLSDSYRDGRYRGPDAVMADIQSMVK